MSVQRSPWHQHGGFYRQITDLTLPWVPSPVADAFTIIPTMSKSEPVDVALPFRRAEKPGHVSSPTHRKRRKDFRVLRALKEWIRATRYAAGAVHADFPSPRVALSEWKAWGYYAYPIVNGVEVSNYPPTQTSPPSVDPEEVFWSLRSPGGSKHPERWVAGMEHPALPPKPTRWAEPTRGAPLPFPWECQLNPFLEHLPFGPPSLCWHLGKHPTSIMFGQTDAAIPLSAADRSQPATWPFVTHMYINAIAEDPMPKFCWPIMVYNPRGVKCEDVFQTIYSNFQEHVTRREFESWEDLRQNPASLAFEARNGLARGDRLRRVDYLGTHYMFRGLEPHPNREGWIMFVGLV